MGIVKKHEIKGVRTDNKILCANCMGECTDYNEDDFILDREIEENTDDLYFCDECKEAL